MDTLATVVDYWTSRACLGKMAGTNDVLAKQLEMRTLLEHIDNGESVLDLGCGNGMSLIWLAHELNIKAHGVDNAEAMVNAAREWAETEKSPATFEVGSVLTYTPKAKYDVVYTERTLVNLGDWSSQKAAILHILKDCVKPGGRYLMVENSSDGLRQINAFRKPLDLPEIAKPWHNRYLIDREIATIEDNEFGHLEDVVNYSSTYYFVSRVCNAFLAKQEGHDPRYDAELNKSALSLPPLQSKAFGGQGRMWVWRAHE